MLFSSNIVWHLVIVSALIQRSRGLDNTKFRKDKSDGLPFLSLNSTVLTFEFEAEAKDDDKQILRQVCPNNYCNGRQTNKSIPDDFKQDIVTSCCIACECGDGCFELGNCCYDNYKLANPERENETEFCTQASMINPDTKTMPVPISYMLYRSCADTENASLVSKCNVSDTKSMDEFIPVYSATTGRNYRNKYCAQCNKDVGEMVAWDCDLHCQNYEDFVLLFDLQNLRDESLIHWLNSEYFDCALYLIPPKNSYTTTCIHPRDMVDRCDVLSPLFHSLGDKCMTYYSPIYTKHSIFKNVFCMMCNEMLRPVEKTNCDESRYGLSLHRAPIIRLLTFWKSNPSALLYGTTSRSEGCLPPLVFHEEINSCIKISCPIIKLPVGGLCYPVFKSLTHGNLDFRVIVKMPGSYSTDDSTILEEVWNLFKNNHGEENICRSKILKISVVESQVLFVVQTIITISEQTDIEEAFELFVNNIDQYGKDEANLFKMEVSKAAVLSSPYKSLVLQFIDDYDKACDAIAMTDLMFCRTIAVTNFERFRNNSLLVNGLLFDPGEYVEIGFENVHVCLDNYLFKHRITINQEQKVQFNGFGTQPINLYYVLISSLLVCATSKTMYI